MQTSGDPTAAIYAVAIRNIRGTSTPYAIPVALALLKLPFGALAALIAMVLLHADFVPGLSEIDSQGQILGYAVVFGYAQQIFTRLIDQRGQSVLDRATTTEPPAQPDADQTGTA